MVRTTVTVGVAYGSPTRKVAKLIREAVDDHEDIRDDPEPVVIFEEFGDSSLVFEVYFWLNVQQPIDRRIIRSDVRHRIGELCKERGITIAFPQRDVHLDTLKPLEITLHRDRGDRDDDQKQDRD